MKLFAFLCLVAFPSVLSASPSLVVTGGGEFPLHGVDIADANPRYELDSLRPAFPSLHSLSPLSGIMKVVCTFGTTVRVPPYTLPDYLHLGVDLKAAIGTPVLAVLDGVVQRIGFNQQLGYFVVLKHAKGHFTIYGHLSGTKVGSGQQVTRGLVIGLTGETGLVTQPALHFAITEDYLTYLDPEPFLPANSGG